MKAKADYLFETSYEVCNKVGGINTVIVSKTNLMKKYYDNYYLIGPYYKNNADLELKKKEMPDFLKEVSEELSKIGIEIHFGTWQIPGNPDTILVDFNNFVYEKDNIKKNLWEWYKIDSLKSQWDFEEPIIWSYAIGIMLEKISQKLKNEKIVSHFHEWLCGGALLYLKKQNSNISTVFTTHATFLGRVMCAHGYDIYSSLETIDGDAMAHALNINDKYMVEKQCSLNADIFTTVSEITAIEAEQFFNRKPEVLVINGLDVSKFPNFEECSVKHYKLRNKLTQMCESYFYPYYFFDIDETLFFFSFARYEFKNKGLDIYIKTLNELNKYLKEVNSSKTIVNIFFIPNQNYGVKREILENLSFYDSITEFVNDKSKKLRKELRNNIMSGEEFKCDEILEIFSSNQKQLFQKFKKQGNPSLVTHYLNNEDNDEIVKAFKENNLLNKKEDKVKVILYPAYLTGCDGLLNLNYYDAISAGHLGIFASYYEPFGYTPLETSVLGVPSVTTDLAGFGRAVNKCNPNKENPGIYILNRMEKEDNETIDEFKEFLIDFVEKDKQKRVLHKMDAKRLSEYFDWNYLILNYIKAHNRAIEEKEN